MPERRRLRANHRFLAEPKSVMLASLPENVTFPTNASEQDAWLTQGRSISFPGTKPEGYQQADWEAVRTIPAATIQSLFDAQTRACAVSIRITNAIIVGPLAVARVWSSD